MRFAVEASPERPVLVDKFLEDATEVDVDCMADVGNFEDPSQGTIVIGGILEHIEFAGVHSGDAAMVLPPHTLAREVIATIRQYTHAMARELKVSGLMNVQYAVQAREGLRAGGQSAGVAHGALCEQGHRRPPGQTGRPGDGRKIPGRPRVHRGSLAQVLGGQGIGLSLQPFLGQDIVLSPEMRSTGEVMGLDEDLGVAYAKSSDGGQFTVAVAWAGIHQRQRRP
jgi:carbamoyl-phosphate synthase large subunit